MTTREMIDISVKMVEVVRAKKISKHAAIKALAKDLDLSESFAESMYIRGENYVDLLNKTLQQ